MNITQASATAGGPLDAGDGVLLRIYEATLVGMNLFASFMVAALMLLITGDVCSRLILGIPFFGVPEIVKLSLVAMLWLQTAYTLRQRNHLRSTLILQRLPPAGQRAVLLVNCASGAAMMALIAYYGADELMRAWRIGAFEGEEPVRVPVWPIWATVVVGAALSCLEYHLQAIRAIWAPDIADEISPRAAGLE